MTTATAIVIRVSIFFFVFSTGVQTSCEKSLEQYRRVAATVASEVSEVGSGPAIQRIRLLDEIEGGTGGTSSGSGSVGNILNSDILDYYTMLAERGDLQAQVSSFVAYNASKLVFYDEIRISLFQLSGFMIILNDFTLSGGTWSIAFPRGSWHLAGSSLSLEILQKSGRQWKPSGNGIFRENVLGRK